MDKEFNGFLQRFSTKWIIGGFFWITPFLPLQAVTSSSNTFVLHEGWLAREALKSSYQIKGINAEVLSKEVSLAEFDTNFDTQLISSLTHMQTNDASSNPAGFIVSPAQEFSGGISKNFETGIGFKAEAFLQQQTFEGNPQADSRSVVGARAEGQIDLGGNFLGVRSKTNQFLLKSNLKAANMDAIIKKNELRKSMRAVYWRLVANRISKNWRLEILSSARRQLDLVEKQASAYVSDQEEVKAYQALVIGQEAEIIGLENQYAAISQHLKSAFPVLTGKDLIIKLAHADKQRHKVMQCIHLIKDIPNKKVIETSSYRHLLVSNEYVYQSSLALNDLSDHPEFKLFAKYETVGYSPDDFSDASKSLSDARKNATTIGVNFSMPITTGLQKTVGKKKRLLATAHAAKQEAIIGGLKSQREASLRQIKLLRDSMVLMERLTQTNESKVAIARKKYDQARLPLAILIQDEINLLNSKLNRVQLQLQIVLTLLDYLKKFDETPCEFNAI